MWRMKLTKVMWPFLGIFIGYSIRYLSDGYYAEGIGLLLWFLGGMANVLVLKLNGWKMPVAHLRCIETATHQPLKAEHKLPWLADRIPIGIGMASIGDVLYWMGLIVWGAAIWMR